MLLPGRLAHIRTYPARDCLSRGVGSSYGAGPRVLDQPQEIPYGPDADATIPRGIHQPRGGDGSALTREGDEHGAVCSTPGRVGSCTRRGMDEGVRPHGQYGSPHTVLPFSHEVYPFAPSISLAVPKLEIVREELW